MDGHITTAQTNKAYAQQQQHHSTKPCRSRTKLTLRIENDILNVCAYCRMNDDYTQKEMEHTKKRKNKNPSTICFKSNHLLQFIDKD